MISLSQVKNILHWMYDPVGTYARSKISESIDRVGFTGNSKAKFEGLSVARQKLALEEMIEKGVMTSKRANSEMRRQHGIIEEYKGGKGFGRDLLRYAAVTFSSLLTVGLVSMGAIALHRSSPQEAPLRYSQETTPTRTTTRNLPGANSIENALATHLTIDTVTFDIAKKVPDGRIRQLYLDKIFKNRDLYGVPGWESFAGFVYDPELKKGNESYVKKGMKIPKPKVKGYSDQGVGLMATPFYGTFGIKSKVYIERASFEIHKNEDDFLSALDNESFHAFYYHSRGMIHVPIHKPRESASVWAIDLLFELLSFDKQFYYIAIGKRRVSKEFLRSMKEPANFLYTKSEELAGQNSIDGKYAQGVIGAIKKRPTLKYFK